jgi:hypothetical protein
MYVVVAVLIFFRIVFPVAEMEAVCKDGVSDVCYKGIIPRQIPQIVAVNAGEILAKFEKFVVLLISGLTASI